MRIRSVSRSGKDFTAFDKLNFELSTVFGIEGYEHAVPFEVKLGKVGWREVGRFKVQVSQNRFYYLFIRSIYDMHDLVIIIFVLNTFCVYCNFLARNYKPKIVTCCQLNFFVEICCPSSAQKQSVVPCNSR